MEKERKQKLQETRFQSHSVSIKRFGFGSGRMLRFSIHLIPGFGSRLLEPSDTLKVGQQTPKGLSPVLTLVLECAATQQVYIVHRNALSKFTLSTDTLIASLHCPQTRLQQVYIVHRNVIASLHCPQKLTWQVYTIHRNAHGKFTLSTETHMASLQCPQKRTWQVYNVHRNVNSKFTLSTEAHIASLHCPQKRTQQIYIVNKNAHSKLTLSK